MSAKEIIKAIENSDAGRFEEIVKSGKNRTLDAGSFKGLHIGALKLHDVDCSNTEWEACLFDGVSFEGVDLGGAYFNGCTFHECLFSAVGLAEVSFDGCVMQKCTIESPSDLESFEMTGCQLKACVLKEMHFSDTAWNSVTVTGGEISGIDGVGTLKSVVLRNVLIERFDTRSMSVSACTSSGCSGAVEGFMACEGRRRRV